MDGDCWPGVSVWASNKVCIFTGIVRMDSNFVIYLGKQTIETALLVAAPILLTCVVVGVVVTLFQAVTSIRDMSLTVVPKLMAVAFISLLFGSWMLGVLLRFTNEIFGHIQNIG